MKEQADYLNFFIFCCVAKIEFNEWRLVQAKQKE
jgi:hypothetical protein